MKIFCNCNCGCKIYLASPAGSRYQLANLWGIVFNINCPLCGVTNNVHVNKIQAEITRNKTPYATTAGGAAIGIIGGPLGIILGAAVGGIAGSVALSKDRVAVQNFNNSYI